MEKKDLFRLKDAIPPAGLEMLDGNLLAEIHQAVLEHGASDGSICRLTFETALDPPFHAYVSVATDMANRIVTVIGHAGMTGPEGIHVMPLVDVSGLPPAIVFWDKTVSVLRDEFGGFNFFPASIVPKIKRKIEIMREILQREGILTHEQLIARPDEGDSLWTEMQQRYKAEKHPSL